MTYAGEDLRGPILGDGTGLEIGRVGGKFLLGGGLILQRKKKSEILICLDCKSQRTETIQQTSSQ